MLFSKKNFRQFFSARPNRRRATVSVPAHVQTLDSKVLLSATAVDAPAEDEPTEDIPLEDEPTEDTPLEDTPTEDTPLEDTPTEETEAATDEDPSISDAAAIVITGETQVSGTVDWNGGSFDGFTISFGGVLSGQDIAINSDGSFDATFDGELTGLATITLLDASGNQVDQFTLFV